MKTIEISEELYEKIMKWGNKHNLLDRPFEVIVWDILASEETGKDMVDRTMQMVIGAIAGKSPEEMEKMRAERKKRERESAIRNGEISL